MVSLARNRHRLDSRFVEGLVYYCCVDLNGSGNNEIFLYGCLFKWEWFFEFSKASFGVVRTIFDRCVEKERTASFVFT